MPTNSTPTRHVLRVFNADELREGLPTSGVFGMLDCEVEVGCPINATTEDIERMVLVIESMINVTDVRISGVPQADDDHTYSVTITDVPYSRTLNKKDK